MPKGSGICVPFGALFSTPEQLCSCQTPWESRILRTGEHLDSLFNCLKAIFQECISLSLHRLQVTFRLYSSPWLQHQNHNGLECVLNGRVLNSSAFRFPRTVGDTGIPSNPRELSNCSYSHYSLEEENFRIGHIKNQSEIITHNLSQSWKHSFEGDKHVGEENRNLSAYLMWWLTDIQRLYYCFKIIFNINRSYTYKSDFPLGWSKLLLGTPRTIFFPCHVVLNEMYFLNNIYLVPFYHSFFTTRKQYTSTIQK